MTTQYAPPMPHPASQGVPACGTQNLVKIYGEGSDRQVVAVNDVSVQIQAGSFTAIMGPSGSGKSTLMHCMAGLDRATYGAAWLGSANLSELSEREVTRIRRDRIGFVFQSFNLLPTLTAEQNITLPLELAGRKVDKGYVQYLTQSLGIADRLSHRPSQLSGGQQQRVAIARALVTRPEVVFADEPTGALDSRTGTQLLEYLRQAAQQGQTIIMVTHDPKAAGYADRALVLLDGRIVEDIPQPSADRMLAIMGRMGA